ncbi:phosphotransferase [Mycoplasma sp. 3341]|uniref:phosphotransferase n=1 Tax=Mycoplasma sp. 3341 TaxID=3447506 RepID=UPI003F65D1FF
MKHLLKNQGFTNKTYFDDKQNTFIKEKQYDEFNHKIDYQILNKFDFSPKVLYDDEKTLVTEFIKGKQPELNKENLIKIGQMLITIHNSKLRFPANNLARRFKVYRQKVSELGRKIDVLDKHYKKINLFLKNIDNSAPCHNDLWLFNFIEDENKNLFITDWEYATMGDVHFDLAYFIESQSLTEEQTQWLYEGYGDDFEPYYVHIHKILVNALVVLWINKHPVKPFDDSLYIKRVDEYMNQLEEIKNATRQTQ